MDKPLNKLDLVAFEKLKLKWKELSAEDIILDGLYLNCTRLVKEYFDKILKIDLKTNKINEIGLKTVVQLLADKDLRGAEILLKHMNFDSNQKIYQICFFTPYKQLREYLIGVLIERKSLNEKELQMINFLKEYEQIYQNNSLLESKKSLELFNNLNINWTNSITDINENFFPKDLIHYNNNNTISTIPETVLYSQVVIEWLREWSIEDQNEILINGLILFKDEMKEKFQEINPDALLKVLVDLNNNNLINEWIQFSFSDNENEDSIFKVKLSQKMIDTIYESKCLMPEYKDIIFNNLAKYNIFCTAENEDFSLKLSRLSKSHQLYNIKLTAIQDESFHLELLTNLLSASQFHANFIWLYADFLTLIKKPIETIIKADTMIMNKDFDMFMSFRPNVDSNNFFMNLNLKNFKFIKNKPNDFELNDLYSEKFKEYHLEALALSLYSDSPLSKKESNKFNEIVNEYSSLKFLLDINGSNQPISIYSLMQEHTKLDMSKCFNWQSSNTFGYENNNKKSLVSFENIEFAKRYAYKTSLDYAYFIKEGRPFFAYYYFIQNQLKKYGKIHKTLMQEAKLRTNLILIDNYEDHVVINSCLTFSEFMNADTFKLKLTVCLMKILSDYYKRRGMDEQLAVEKCKHVFEEFFKGELSCERVVSMFEHILVNNLIENFDLKKMFTLEAASIWLPLMCFCKVYNLPFSCKYLQKCAESNQWLMFLIFAQIFQIPRYQVISALENFKDIGLKQHLEYSLHNVINLPNSDKNNKKNLEKKKKSSKTAKPKTKSKASKVVLTSSSSNSDSEEKETNKSNNKTAESESLESIDFYELLINCQNMSDPVLQLQIEAIRWFAPVLSVFATFYQQHDKISCLCSFLYASLKHPVHIPMAAASGTLYKVKSILFGLNDLKEAIQMTASKSYLRTLLNSLKIFLPNSILDIYVEFIYSVFVIKDLKQAQKLYSNYKYELIKITLSKHQSYIPIEWYEEVINKLTKITIIKCYTIDDLLILTKIITQNNEYRRLIKLVHTLKSNKISVSSDEWLDMDDKSDQFNEICFKVIEELLKLQKFNEAEDLADFCELSKDRIHLARIGHRIEKIRLNNDFEEILLFWKNAHIQLMQIGIKDTDFIDFLKFQNSQSNLMLEKIVLLNLICQLCPNNEETSKMLWNILLQFVNDYKKKNETTNLKEIFKKMLLFGNLNKYPIRELYNFIINEGITIDFNDYNNSSISDQEKDAFDILLFNLVDIGKLTQAYVIARHFKYFNQDLRILLNMIYISLDMIKPDDLDYGNSTFDLNSFKKIKLTNVLRSLSKQAPDPSETIRDHIQCMDKLTGLCSFGDRYCQRIKLDFRLANEYLHVNFIDVLNENEWNILKKVICSFIPNKYDLAKQIVNIYDIENNTLCDFMIDQVMLTLNAHVESIKNNTNLKQPLPFDPTNAEDFSSLIKIFKTNSNLFGIKLLEKARKLLTNDPKTTDNYMILTELLIRSHLCFLQSCSMEGISNVLEASKQCASKLEKAREFNIMIRLLIGIDHFSEMTYIMDFLWNNQQFEMLFSKGIGKNDKLRLALLDYLKRNHPNDNETYTMFTLNFTMHREIAVMLEEAAYEQLKLLENKQIENSSDILTDLQSILQYFGDAAQSYMKEDCVKQAELCIKKARLIALQISFLSRNLIIINLNSNLATKLIVDHSNFWEAYIISEAYEKKSDWSHALFNQFILNNNIKYLTDFRAHIQLSSSMIEEIANRYKLTNETLKMSNQSSENMKKLLKYCKDISQYYRLITQLDFTDCIDELKTKNYISIVNDLILNKKI